MRFLLASFFLLVAVPINAVWPLHGPLPVAAQAQTKTDDGPYVLWKGDMAQVHWVKGGAHVEESFKAPFRLNIPGFESAEVRLDGKPYAEIKYELPAPQKIFAISDIHGVFDVMRELLVVNKVIDSKNRWTFGKGHLVILGDIADRGDQMTEAFWFVRALEESARNAGGGVHMIIGNHEVMVMTGDYHYTNQKYLNQPDGMPGLAQLWGTESEIGRWLRSRPLMMKLGDLLFVHGGVSPVLIDRGLDIATVNRGRRFVPRTQRNELDTFLLGNSGPIWYRGLVLDGQEDSISSTDLNRVLTHFNVKRIVVGHTIVESVRALHGGRVLAIDAAIQHRKGEGLYIEKGKAYRALKDGSKVEI
jgi:hypothetical protein